MKTFREKVNKNKFYREYLRILNGLLQLSSRETDVLVILMEIDSKWKPFRDENKDILTSSSRKLIMKETGINKTNLSKYLSRLRGKSIIIQNKDGGYEINSKLMPNIVGDIYEMVFVLDLNLKDD